MFRDTINGTAGARESLWGQLAGHQHRNFNGSAFDNEGWDSFRQIEASAVKGDVFDSDMASTFLVLTVDDDGEISAIDRHWRERGEWKVAPGK